MKILFLFLFSFIYIFGDAVYPAGTSFVKNTNKSCTPASGTCQAGTCLLDQDGIKHCIEPSKNGGKASSKDADDMYYIYSQTSCYVEENIEKIKGYLDSSRNNKLKKREEGSFKSVIGDMDVIGATVVIPKVDGYKFDPTKAGADPSPVVEKRYVNEEPSLSTSKFPNSSRATFTFSGKSEHEKKYVDGSKIKYARLYWGGSIYKEWYLASDYTDEIFKDIYGYSRVNFKTPKGTFVVQASKDDIKLVGSFSQGYRDIITKKSFNGDNTEEATLSGRGGYYYVYQASADVTKQVQDSLGNNPEDKTPEKRTFAVGGIASTIVPLTRETGKVISFKRGYPEKIDPNERCIAYQKTFRTPYGAILYADGKWNSSFGASQFGGWSLVIVYDMGEEGRDKGVKPRSINLYDGMADIYPNAADQDEPSQSFDLKFDEFYTPKSGSVKTTLAFMGFGGKPEVSGEDIQVENKNTNKFESIFSLQNPKGKLFNSSISRFDKPAVEGRTFNGQMDLDLIDISDKMTNKQEDVGVRFKAKGYTEASGTFNGDRQNIGMVAFSTLLYDPDVCYEENLAIKSGVNNWIAITPNTKIKVKKGSLLRSTVTILNRGNEDAHKAILRVKLKPESMIYENDTSKIITSGTNLSNSNWAAFDDNGKYLNKIDNYTLEYNIGTNATYAIGGELTHGQGNFARVQFDSKIEDKYKKTEYEAKFINNDTGLQYDYGISRCDDGKNYELEVVKEKNNFYPRSKENDPNGDFKNRLFTKIVNKPFYIFITNYSEVDQTPKTPEFPIDVDLKLVENCSDEESVLGKQSITLHFTNKDTEKVRVAVPRAYKALRVKLTYLDELKNKNKVVCEVFDAFAVRPAMFQLYDKSGSGGVYNGSSVLVGGKDYKDITLAAYNMDKTTLANGYTNTLIAGSSVTGANRHTENNVSILPVDKAGCIITEDTKKRLSEDNKLKIAFDNPAKAVGTITNLKTNKEGFSFSDIGNAKFYVVDKSYTSIDKKTPPQDSDCVLDKSDNNENTEGKVGCDIEFGEKKFGFEPNDLEVSEFKILPRGISYVANESSASFTPILSFKVKARLFDDNPALLYKDGCYSNNTRFKIKVGEMIDGYTDNNGTLLKNDTDGLAKLNSEILFFGNLDASKVEKVHPASLHEGLFEVKKEAFKGGYADVNLKFNFKREKNVAKNPFEVTSDTFTFESLVDANKTKNNGNYKKPTTKTSAKFYYARTYAPYYEGPNTGFKAKIYYGVYCNGCDESKFMLQKPGSSARWEEFAGTHSWYVNPLHDASYGNVDSYEFSNHTTRDTAKETALSDGVSYIYVKNDRAVTDIAKMHTENWLIYNEFDKDAATNDFTVRFLVPNGDWAGKTLKSGSSKGDVGNVIGGENNFNDLSDKTNRRISW